MAAASGSSRHEDEEVNAVCAEPKLFLGSLRYDVSQDDVKAHYASRFGPLRSGVLLTHHDTGKSKGCALVLFESWAAAEAAVVAENGAQTELSAPRPAVVKFADPQRNEHGILSGVTPRKLFIGQVGGGWGGGGVAILGGGGGVSLFAGERSGIAMRSTPPCNPHSTQTQVPPDVTEEHIRSIFDPYGAIVDFNIMPPRKPGSMGEWVGEWVGFE